MTFNEILRGGNSLRRSLLLSAIGASLLFATCGKGGKDTQAERPAAQQAMDSSSMAMDHSQASMDMDKAPKPMDRKNKKILYWRAPMDPTYISDKPGKSPMGMDLIPVYEGDADVSAGPTIAIDPVTMQNMGVKTAKVEVRDLYRDIRTVGHLDYDEDKLSRINVKFSGWVEKLFASETGEPVRKGEPLLEIYSPDLVSTQEEYLLALRNQQRLAKSTNATISEGANSLLESARRRLLYWDITEKQIQRLETSDAIQKTMTVYSPVDGIVVGKHVEEGMRVGPGMDLYRVADLTSIWVYGHIFEYEVPWIKIGEKVQLELPYLPGEVFEGRVQYVYPYLDPKTRDVKIRVELPNPGLKLKPEMYANIQIRSRVGENVVVVPDESIIRSGKRNVVFVSLGGGKFEPRDVVLGAEGGDGYYEVLAGVQPGEDVVVSAQFLLDSESRLKEAIQKMLETRTGKQHDMQGMQHQEQEEQGMQQMDHGNQDMQNQKSEQQPQGEQHNH